jgi:hypothetical protein
MALSVEPRIMILFWLLIVGQRWSSKSMFDGSQQSRFIWQHNMTRDISNVSLFREILPFILTDQGIERMICRLTLGDWHRRWCLCYIAATIWTFSCFYFLVNGVLSCLQILRSTIGSARWRPGGKSDIKPWWEPSWRRILSAVFMPPGTFGINGYLHWLRMLTGWSAKRSRFD